jgi:hypothetical protein
MHDTSIDFSSFFYALSMSITECLCIHRMPETNTATTSQEMNVLKRKSDDVGWEYGSLVDPSQLDKVKCMFCNHVSTGGVYRLKQHVANVSNAVAK